MKLQPATVDVLLSTLDQQAPKTATPIGRLSRLVNGVVKRYLNPRAADGTVTHVRVEKRDAFLALPTTTKDMDGVASTLTGTPQILFDGGDALREVAGNRLFTRSGHWVKASDATNGDTVVLPQTLRSSEIYTADSQTDAPDMAMIGDVACIAWREVALQASSNAAAPSVLPAPGLDGVRVTFVDGSDRSIIRPAFNLNPSPGTTYLKIRVLAYGGYFWVLQDNQTSGGTVEIDVTIFDENGTFVATTSISPTTNNLHWDAIAITGQGVVIAMPNNGSGVRFMTVTYSAGFVTTAVNDTTIKQTPGQPCVWLTNDFGGSKVGYLATGFTNVTTSIYAYKIVNSAQTNEYPVVASAIDTAATSWISGIAGYVVNGSTFPLVVAYTLMDIAGEPEATRYGSGTNGTNSVASNNYPNQLNNRTFTVSVPFTGAATAIMYRWAMSVASRAFSIDGDYCVIGYYPGCQVGPLGTATAAATHFPQRPANPSNFQPCWYILPLASKQPIAGRFEYGLATADWQVLAYDGSIIAGPRNRSLPSICTTSSGALAVPLAYRAEQNIPSAKLFTQQTVTDTTTTTSSLFLTTSRTDRTVVTNSALVYQTANTVGVKLFTIGPDCGQPIAVNGTTFVPGLMAGVIETGDVTMTEHGLVAPECPYVIKSGTASTPAADGIYFWRWCGEYVTQTGKTYRSLPSAAFAFKVLVSDAVGIDVKVHSLAPTNKANVKLSGYRTAYTDAAVFGSAQVTDPPLAGGTTVAGFSSISYKITNDLRPFYNSRLVNVATFIDLVNLANQAVGEVLYTDQGYLPRFPAPAFRSGAVWQNRLWLIGYDNALWFSGDIQEGVGEWFNPGQRVVLPTTEEITAVASMETFLLIFTASSTWYLPQGAALPDATGQGTIPTAQRLPFEYGCTGFTAVTTDGCLYTNSLGGVWIITRSLDNRWIGQDAKDDLDVEITGMVIVGNYVCVATRTGGPMNIVVYDTQLGAWGVWQINADNSLSTTLIGGTGGQLAWADSGRVKVQTPGSYLDDGTTYVSTEITISPVHIGGVRNWKRTWAIQFEGEVYDACALVVGLAYDDSGDVAAVYDAVQLEAGLLEEEVRPTKQLAAAVGITIQDIEGDVAPSSGQGLALEVASFYIGVEKGLAKGVPRARHT